MAVPRNEGPRRTAVIGLALLSSTLLSACATAGPAVALRPPPRPAVSHERALFAAAPALPAAPEEPPAPMPPGIAAPEEVGCSWTTARLAVSRQKVELRLRPGGPAFAEVTAAAARVQTPAHEHDHAILDARSGGLVMSGAVDAKVLRLFATSPFAMNGVLYPQPTMALSWIGGGPGKAIVSADAPSELTPAKPLSATVACGAVSLDSGRALDMTPVLLGGSHGQSYSVATGRFIQVHSDPTKPSEARLFLSGAAIAQGLDSLGGFTFITLGLGDSVVAGWVRTVNLSPINGGMGNSRSLFSLRGWVLASPVVDLPGAEPRPLL